MAAIHTIKIKNFKAFPVEQEILFDGKNVVVYGENGSGKSSVYFALYTVLQASIIGKNTDKYFDRANPENLLNVFTGANDAHIKISFIDAPATFYSLATGGLNPRRQADIRKIDNLNLASDFISHRLLINFYNFRNSYQINLWKVFERDIIPYKKTINQAEYIGDVYNDIKTNVPYKMRAGNVEAKQVSRDYLLRIEYFNTELETLVNDINLEATDFYNQNFRKSTENKLEIKLHYLADGSPAREPGDSNRYFVRYETLVKKISIAHVERDYITGFKDLTEPFVRLSIRENIGTDAAPNWKAIDRPQSYLNEAKLTGIALSIRFAMLVGANRPAVDGRILALDDLLVSLDMSNRDRVIKIILEKFISENPFKIYIFTHDKSFYNLCKQRITQTGNPTNWLFYEMYADMDKVPRRPYIDTHTDYFEKAEKHVKAFEYSASATAIRQGLENLLFNFLPENLRYKDNNGKIESRTLGELLGQFQSFLMTFNQRPNVIQDLFVYKDILLNPLSHDNVNTPVFRNELDAIMAIIPILKTLQTSMLKELTTPPNNVIRLQDTNTAGQQITYSIELHEHLRSFTLLDGNYYLSKTKCKVIEMTDHLGTVTSLNNNYNSIRQAGNRLAQFLGKTYANDQAIFNQFIL